MPKVSICMPNYNYARYLPEAIESALRQSYADFELVIVDNCSTDNSVEVIKRYASADSRIRLSINDQNVGLVNNLNLCLHKARGEYIKFLFSDDMFASDRALEHMVSILDRHENIALVASARNVIDDRSTVIKIWSEYDGKLGYRGSRIIQDCLIEQKNKIGEPSVVLFRKKHATRGFDVRYRQAVDLELWFHILEQGDFAFLEEPLYSFRIHYQQQTKVNMGDIDLTEEPFLLLHDYANKPYIAMPLLVREYMHYVPVYALWKLYKNERISRKAALDKIQERYSLFKYFAYYPLYKSYKFMDRILKSIIAMMQSLMSSRRGRGEPPRTVCAPIEGLQREQDYYEYTRTEILELLPDSPSKVLEIGCGAGNTLVWLKKLKHCSWIGGVEMSEGAALLAREKLDALYPVNIEHNSLPIKEGSLDLILCLDVLEHMVDPWSVLRRLRSLLKPGGALIASIPNVRNQRVIFPLLLKGKWDYADSGILDKSHLRFFVRDSAVDLIASSRLKVDLVLSTGLGRSRRSRVMNALTPSLIKSLFEKQYLIRGIRVD